MMGWEAILPWQTTITLTGSLFPSVILFYNSCKFLTQGITSPFVPAVAQDIWLCLNILLKNKANLAKSVELWEVTIMLISVDYLRRDCTQHRWYNIYSYNHECTVHKENNIYLSCAQSIMLWCMLFGLCSLLCLVNGNSRINHEKTLFSWLV